MKNIIYMTNWFKLMLLCLMFMNYSCESVRDTYTDFIGDGERIYVGKIDSIKIFSGYQRIQVEGLLHYARTAKEVVIEWEDNGQANEIITDISSLSKYDTMRIDVGNLSEGILKLRMYSRDNHGNKSVVDEALVDVYGDNFIKTLSGRGISKMELGGSLEINIEMNDPEYYVVDTKLSWTTNAGKEESVILKKNDTKCVINDWAQKSQIKATTRALIKANDLDTLVLESAIYNVPLLSGEHQMVAKGFTWVPQDVDPSNTRGDGYGGAMSALFDGNEGTFIHTHDGGSIPMHFTYDMQRLASLTKGAMSTRAQTAWKVQQFQIWVLPDFDGKVTSSQFPTTKDNYENKDAWVTEAKSLGWSMIYESPDEDLDLATPVGVKAFSATNVVPSRYIIYRVLKIANGAGAPSQDGNSLYSCTRELYLWETFD